MIIHSENREKCRADFVSHEKSKTHIELYDESMMKVVPTQQVEMRVDFILYK